MLQVKPHSLSYQATVLTNWASPLVVTSVWVGSINAAKLVDHKVAVVGITPIVNKENGIKNLTTKQLIAIFTGKVTNWRQVGGHNQKIVIDRSSVAGLL